MAATTTTSTTKSQSAYYDDDNNNDYVMVHHADVDGGGGGGDCSFQQQWCHKWGRCGCSLFCKTPKRCLTGVAIALLYWILLWVVAKSYSPGLQRFTLTVGETWQVLPPMNLWSRKSLSIQAFPAEVVTSYNKNNESSTTSATASLEVYEFLPVLDYRDPAPCPPLTLGDDPIASIHSPILTLHESQKIVQLGSRQHNYRQYEYEYFHLNQGSVLNVHTELVASPSQHHNDNDAGGGLGATNIYILQGYHALEELVEHDDDANMELIQGFRGKSIEKWFLAYSGAVDLEYAVPESDYYIIVYDNAAPGRTTNLQVSVTVEMATHYLSEVSRPICSAKNTITPHGCAFIFTNDQDRQRVASTCIIVKAVSPQLDREVHDQMVNVTSADDSDGGDTTNQGDENDTTSQGSDSLLPKVDLLIEESQSVIVQVHAPLGSTRFIVLALLPIMLLSVLWFMENGQKCMQHMRHHGCASSFCPCCPSQGRRCQQSKVQKKQVLPVVDERTPLNQSRIP